MRRHTPPTRADSLRTAILIGAILGWACRALEAEPLLPKRSPSDELSSRRARVIAAMMKAGGDHALLLLRSAPESAFAGDVAYPYRPENNLYYLTGIDAPGCALLLQAEPRGPGKQVLFLEQVDPGARAWIGEGISREQASERSGIPLESIVDAAELRDRVQKLNLFQGAQRGSPYLSDPFYFETGPGFGPGRAATEPYAFLLENMGSLSFHLDMRNPASLLDRLRQVKSPSEIVQLEKAIDATSKALLKASRALKPGIFEFEIRSVIEGTFLREGCPGWSFPPIVGSGPNSCILHYERYDRRAASGDLVVLDIGAQYGCYSADVTRTFPVNGKFSARQRQVYEIVLKAQEAAIRIIRPGVAHSQVNTTAFQEVTAGLKSIGLIAKDDETHKYFFHGASHGLGLDVHDAMPETTLAPGMVITVEPGVYIASEGLGVRIEDDVLVTEDGCRVLSHGSPKSVDEIEDYMASREF